MQPKDAATLVVGFITLVFGLDKFVVLPATLAFTVLHVSVGVVFLILHFLTKASLLVELLLQGIIRTNRAAFATSGAVIAATVAIGHVAAVYLHPVIWFGSFWAWQAGIDLVVVYNATAVCSWLLKKWLEGGGCVAAIDSSGRTIWIADAHRDDGRRFVVHADEKLTAFLELQAAIRAVRTPRGLRNV